MRIFNEESKKGEVLILLKTKEGKDLIEALEDAVKHRPRKIVWRRLLNELSEKAGVY